MSLNKNVELKSDHERRKMMYISNEKDKFFSLATFPGIILKFGRLNREVAIYEKDFYAMIFNDRKYGQDGVDSFMKDTLDEWKYFLPKYYGTTYDILGQNEYAVLIENLLWGYSTPCFMDLKAGFSNASVKDPALIEHKKKSCPLREQMGFSFDGYLITKPAAIQPKIYGEEDSVPKPQQSYYPKKQARSKSRDEIVKYIERFVSNCLKLKIDICEWIIEELIKIERLLGDKRNCLRFFSTSLMIAYDSSGKSVEEMNPKVKLIDFEHVLLEELKTNDSNGDLKGDQNVVGGIKNIRAIFGDILSGLKGNH